MKAVVLVEARGRVVDRVDDDRPDAELGADAQHPLDRIEDEESAEARAPRPLIDRQTPEQDRRHILTPGESPALRFGQVIEEDFGGAEGVVGEDGCRCSRLDQDKGARTIPSFVLADELAKVAVEVVVAAGKAPTVVRCSEYLDRVHRRGRVSSVLLPGHPTRPARREAALPSAGDPSSAGTCRRQL